MNLNAEYMAKSMGIQGPPPHTSQFSDRILVKTFPFLGRIHFVKDRGGILSLLFVIWYWIYGTWCGIFVILMPHYEDGEISGIFIMLYIIISLFCISSVLRAATTNPGRVPLLEEISGLNLEEYEVCRVCQRRRPKRAHHCRRCQQCVLRMDHHCPWINNCVGEENHWVFVLVIVYAFMLSASAFLICMLHFWYFPPCQKCDKDAFLVKHSIWFTYLLTVMGLFMSLFMLGQFIGQHFNLVMDRTTLQNMKQPRPSIDEINYRTVAQGYQEMFGEGRAILRLFPCRSRRRQQEYVFSQV